jgi:hypothetical protein
LSRPLRYRFHCTRSPLVCYLQPNCNKLPFIIVIRSMFQLDLNEVDCQKASMKGVDGCMSLTSRPPGRSASAHWPKRAYSSLSSYVISPSLPYDCLASLLDGQSRFSGYQESIAQLSLIGECTEAKLEAGRRMRYHELCMTEEILPSTQRRQVLFIFHNVTLRLLV